MINKNSRIEFVRTTNWGCTILLINGLIVAVDDLSAKQLLEGKEDGYKNFKDRIEKVREDRGKIIRFFNLWGRLS